MRRMETTTSCCASGRAALSRERESQRGHLEVGCPPPAAAGASRGPRSERRSDPCPLSSHAAHDLLVSLSLVSVEKVERDIEAREASEEAQGNLDALQQRQARTGLCLRRADSSLPGSRVVVLCGLAGRRSCVLRHADASTRAAVATNCALPSARARRSPPAHSFAAAPSSPQIFDSRAAFRRLANELEEIFKAQDYNMVCVGGGGELPGWLRAAWVGGRLRGAWVAATQQQGLSGAAACTRAGCPRFAPAISRCPPAPPSSPPAVGGGVRGARRPVPLARYAGGLQRRLAAGAGAVQGQALRSI